MLTIDIPGFGRLELSRLVLDYNGTLALDGEILPGVAERLGALSRALDIVVVTADTRGTAASRLSGLPCRLAVLPKGSEAESKLHLVRELGPTRTVCIGNGRNDRLMLHEAALGIAVIGREGASTEALAAARIVVTSILDGLDLVANPVRLVATLRA